MSHNNQTVRIISVSPTVNLLEVFLGRGKRETAKLSFVSSRGRVIVSFLITMFASCTNSFGLLESSARLALVFGLIRFTLDTPIDQVSLSVVTVRSSIWLSSRSKFLIGHRFRILQIWETQYLLKITCIFILKHKRDRTRKVLCEIGTSFSKTENFINSSVHPQ